MNFKEFYEHYFENRPLSMDEKIRKFMQASGWDKLSKEELFRVVSEQLEVMVKNGDVEQLIGEDGEFYYRKAT